MIGLALFTLLLAALGIASPVGVTESRQSKRDDMRGTFRVFSYLEVEKTQFSKNEDGMSSPMMIPGIGTNWGCTKERGPNPLDCPPLFGEWNDATMSEKEGIIRIPSKECFSMKRNTCEALICAPGETVEVEASLVAARMMNPCQTTCAVNGKGGVWKDEKSTVWVEVKRAQ